MEKMGQLAENFFELHHRAEPFVIPNPWDLGSARMLEAKGFKALATTSSGFVFAEGKKEGSNERADILNHCREIVAAVDIPVSADLEHGYADDLKDVEETYRLAAEIGLAGASIEDARIMTENPLYEMEAAAERVRAAVQGARSGPGRFTLTARAENYLYGNPDLGDTIRRLQAFQEAGADVLYAPGLKRLEDIQSVIASIDLPLNVLAGLPDTPFTLTDLARVGVKRISVGSSLFRLAFGNAMDAADEMLTAGTFGFASRAKSFQDINALFS